MSVEKHNIVVKCLVFCCVIFLGYACVSSILRKKTDSIKIMPIGDSITQGNAKHNSYRRPLYHLLTKAGYSVDFVGSLSTNLKGDPPIKDFDTDHEGHWGWRAEQILEKLPCWLKRNRPDIALIHIGSNDILCKQGNEGTIKEIESIIAELRKSNPKVIIFLATVIPTKKEEDNDTIFYLNYIIKLLPRKLDMPLSPLYIVDQNTGFNAHMYTYDGLHPNEEGEELMAQKWYDAMKLTMEPVKTVD
ncbi:MAG: cellulose-binding protein [bacterium]|nr:cellulose-binding protein [bacterium]